MSYNSALTPFRAYEIFLCMKRHWNAQNITSYDFTKYKGKSKNLTQITFGNTPERKFFVSLSEMFKTEEEFILFLIPNFLYNISMAYGEFFSPEAKKRADDWSKKIRSMKRYFKKDSSLICEKLVKDKVDFMFLFTSDMILDMLVKDEIQPESFIIFDRLIFFLDKNSKSSTMYNVLYAQKIKRYSYFISVDLKEYKKVFEKCFQDAKKEELIKANLSLKEETQCDNN